jgi:hypothetical protein
MAIKQTEAGHWVGTIKMAHSTITTAGPSRSVVYSKLTELLGQVI